MDHEMKACILQIKKETGALLKMIEKLDRVKLDDMTYKKEKVELTALIADFKKGQKNWGISP